jgi:glycosyltransferase involved in cell wall biosynthesis
MPTRPGCSRSTRTLRAADLIVAVSDRLRQSIAIEYNIDPSRIVTIENGVDGTAHATATGVGHEVPTLGFLGSLYPWQRLDDLIAALATPENAPWRLRIAGTGTEMTALKAQVERLGLADRVEFLGRVHPDEVPGFLGTVDLCYAGHDSTNGVYFSPLKLWEYLAAGRPVLASSHEATLTLEQAGFPLRCFESPSALATALHECLADRDKLMSIARAKQQQVWEDYSWSARLTPLLTRIGVAQ